MQRRVGSNQFGPLFVGQLGLHAAAPTRAGLARFVLGGPQHVPAQIDDRARGGLFLGLLDHQVAMQHGIFILAVGEAEIGTPDSGILTRQCIHFVVILRTLIGKVMLPGENALAGYRAKGLKQRTRLGSGVGIHRFAVLRKQSYRGNQDSETDFSHVATVSRRAAFQAAMTPFQGGILHHVSALRNRPAISEAEARVQVSFT
jgi:hypothetical protein